MDNRGLRILVVDDDPSSRQFLGALVEQSGSEAFLAADGPEALARIRDLQPHLVITDHRMPAMDGIELTRAIRSTLDGCQPYIILTSVLDDEDLLAEALEAGVDDLVTKPFRKSFLAARLRAGQKYVRLQRANQRHLRKLQMYSEELACSNLRLRELTITDELTSLPNRRYAMERLKQEWNLACRQGTALSCMVIDLDGLKQINDGHGPERGDVILKTVAAIIRTGVGSQDVVCRIGSDEFLVIAPGSGAASLLDHGERLVSAVGAFRIHSEGCPLGLCIGVAERSPDVATPQQLIKLADQGMYYAKLHGKNHVYCRQDNQLRTIPGLSDLCPRCRAKGRTARGRLCLWKEAPWSEMPRVDAPVALPSQQLTTIA